MKKTIFAAILAVILMTGVVQAQATSDDLQARISLLNQIVVLLQKVQELKAQLEALQASAAQLIPSNNNPGQTGSVTPPVDSSTTTASTTQSSNPPVVAPVVSISRGSDGNSVVITNIGSNVLRIKSLSVVSAGVNKLASITAGSVVYPVNTDDGQNILNCSGLKSLGVKSTYGNPAYDVCARHGLGVNDLPPLEQRNLSKNDIAPGESVTLGYVSGIQGVLAGPGTIIDVSTGNSVDYQGVTF